MAAVDEARESGRLAEARRRREQADRLVSPRRIERMFVDGHQFEMGEAQIDDIGDQRVGQLVVAQHPAVRARRHDAEMHLVDRQRRAARIAQRARSPSIRRRTKRRASVSRTTDAVDGRSSAPKPTGIGLQRQQCRRRRRRISYL